MNKVIFKFVAIFLVVYFILIMQQIGMGDKYAAFLRWEAQYFLGNFRSIGVAEFLPNKDTHSWNFPTNIHIYNSKHYAHSLKTGATYQWTRISLDLYHDFLFVAFLLALILATPLPLKRKIPALLLALLLIQLYVNFTIYIEMVNTFNKTPVLEAPPLSPVAERIVHFLHPIVRVNYGTGFFVAVFIWIVVCFRKEDLTKLMKLTEYKE
ncbi:MAG: hypothetical protein SH857_13845 [Chitinophagales bacterium]|nr:hypothetical protein [Chitinophagales bacterium]